MKSTLISWHLISIPCYVILLFSQARLPRRGTVFHTYEVEDLSWQPQEKLHTANATMLDDRNRELQDNFIGESSCML